ncbi:MAG: hypothetical protein ACKVSF_15555 [Alphaproteobacteria bacterium]
MLKGRTKTIAALVLLTGVGATVLTGCESIEKETGIGKSTQTGVLGGATFGGIIAALAGANPAWIAASVVLGGITGGAIGNYLGKDEAQKHAETNLRALDTLGQGQSSSWTDNKSGNSGSTTVNSVATKADGTVCKGFTETIRTSARTVTETATACKASGGTWKVQA